MKKLTFIGSLRSIRVLLHFYLINLLALVAHSLMNLSKWGDFTYFVFVCRLQSIISIQTVLNQLHCFRNNCWLLFLICRNQKPSFRVTPFFRRIKKRGVIKVPVYVWILKSAFFWVWAINWCVLQIFLCAVNKTIIEPLGEIVNVRVHLLWNFKTATNDTRQTILHVWLSQWASVWKRMVGRIYLAWESLQPDLWCLSAISSLDTPRSL